MKKKVLALILGLAMVLTTLVYAEVDASMAEQETPAPEGQFELDQQTPESAAEAPAEEDDVLPDGEETAEPETPAAPETEAPENTEGQEPGTREPADEEPAVTDAPADAETQEPEPTETPEASAEPETTEAPAFTANVKIRRTNRDQLYYGDSVTLVAIVEDASEAYTVRWAYYDVEASLQRNEAVWVECFTGEAYTFILDEFNAELTYRALVNDTVECTYTLPAVLQRPEQSEEAAIEEEPAAQEAAVEKKTDRRPVKKASAPAAAQAEPELDPNRSIRIHAEWEGDAPAFGAASTLVAELTGYDNAAYTLQWQTSKDNVTWVDAEGATEPRYQMIVTEENYLDYWRVVVTVTDVTE